jgi:hypothetical protein
MRNRNDSASHLRAGHGISPRLRSALKRNRFQQNCVQSPLLPAAFLPVESGPDRQPH